MLDIIPSWNPVQYEGKLMMQTWENDENPNFGLPKIFCVSFTSTSSILFQAIILYNLKEYYWTKLERMAKNLISDPILALKKFFSWVLPLLVVTYCSILSFFAISRKTNKPNFRNSKKTNFGPPSLFCRFYLR